MSEQIVNVPVDAISARRLGPDRLSIDLYHEGVHLVTLVESDGVVVGDALTATFPEAFQMPALRMT